MTEILLTGPLSLNSINQSNRHEITTNRYAITVLLPNPFNDVKLLNCLLVSLVDDAVLCLNLNRRFSLAKKIRVKL